MKKLWSIIAGILFVLFLLLTLYPLIGQTVNLRYQSEVYADYHREIRSQDQSALDEVRSEAMAYNATLVSGASDAFTDEMLRAAQTDYLDLLNVTESGIMGYVDIPAIEANLPIYHGTGKDSLNAGLGHLLGTSLPVGGSSTHCVLSGHTGMASQKMLTDLDRLRAGDRFYLEVLGETLTYEVDSIHVVLPHDTSFLNIIPKEDHVTLLTCTPYGVNSHRLLVRGTRVLDLPESPGETSSDVTAEVVGSTWEDQYIHGVLIGTLCAGVFLLVLLIVIAVRFLYRKRAKHE